MVPFGEKVMVFFFLYIYIFPNIFNRVPVSELLARPKLIRVATFSHSVLRPLVSSLAKC